MKQTTISAFETIQTLLSELLDVEADEITPESYLVRDLDAESIDLLEASLELSRAFNIEIDDDVIYLRSLRIFIEIARETGEDTAVYLKKRIPHLTRGRIATILDDLDHGPVLIVEDLIRYTAYEQSRAEAG